MFNFQILNNQEEDYFSNSVIKWQQRDHKVLVQMLNTVLHK